MSQPKSITFGGLDEEAFDEEAIGRLDAAIRAYNKALGKFAGVSVAVPFGPSHSLAWCRLVRQEPETFTVCYGASGKVLNYENCEALIDGQLHTKLKAVDELEGLFNAVREAHGRQVGSINEAAARLEALVARMGV